MKDRIPTYPGRVTMTPVPGQENTYDLVRADEPVEPGTPLSKGTLLKDGTAALYGLDGEGVPDDVLAKLAASVLTMGPNPEPLLVRDMVIGADYNLAGAPCKCIASGYPVGDSKMFMLTATSNTGQWASHQARADQAFNNIPLSLQGVCQSVTIGTQVTDKKCFNLSHRELGGGTGEGTAIPYFDSDAKRSMGTIYWTRTEIDTSNAYIVNTAGALQSVTKTGNRQVRPVIVIPDATKLYLGGDGRYYVTPTRILTDISGDPLAFSPAQLDKEIHIAEGSYVGTGTSGPDNPNTLAVGFRGRFAFITRNDIYPTNDREFALIGNQSGVVKYNSNSFVTLTAATSHTTMSWWTYTTGIPIQQANESGKTYRYIVIGDREY